MIEIDEKGYFDEQDGNLDKEIDLTGDLPEPGKFELFPSGVHDVIITQIERKERKNDKKLTKSFIVTMEPIDKSSPKLFHFLYYGIYDIKDGETIYNERKSKYGLGFLKQLAIAVGVPINKPGFNSSYLEWNPVKARIKHERDYYNEIIELKNAEVNAFQGMPEEEIDALLETANINKIYRAVVIEYMISHITKEQIDKKIKNKKTLSLEEELKDNENPF